MGSCNDCCSVVYTFVLEPETCGRDVGCLDISIAASRHIRFVSREMLLPTYLVAGIIFIVLTIKLVKEYRNRVTGYFAEKQKPKWRSWLQLMLVAMLALVSGAGSGLLTWYFPAFTIPDPTGKFAIGTFSQQLVDETREETFTPESGDKRELMINVWYPVNPEDAKGITPESYPSELGEAISLVFGIPPRVCSATLIPFRHMWLKAQPYQTQAVLIRWCCSLPVSVLPFQSMTAVEELVDGYIVVGMDHPYTSARVTFPDGRKVSYEAGPEFATSEELYQYNVEGVGIRAADARFVLDTLEQWNRNDPNQVLEGRLDLNHTGIMGHSYGGATTAEALAQDERLHAGLGLEGGFWGSISKTSLKQPFMYIMSGETAKSFDPNATSKDNVFYPLSLSRIE